MTIQDVSKGFDGKVISMALEIPHEKKLSEDRLVDCGEGMSSDEPSVPCISFETPCIDLQPFPIPCS